MVSTAEAVISFTYLHIVQDFINVHSYAPGDFCYHLLCFGYQYQRSVKGIFRGILNKGRDSDIIEQG